MPAGGAKKPGVAASYWATVSMFAFGATMGGAIVMAARIKVAPYEPQDPFLRKLR